MKTYEIKEALQPGFFLFDTLHSWALLSLLSLRSKNSVPESMAGNRDVEYCLLRCWSARITYDPNLCSQDPVSGCPSPVWKWT